MPNIKAILFDADGVTIIPNEPFSFHYARENNFDPETLRPFFEGDFQLATIGQADLKDLLNKHRDTWHLKSSPDDLIAQWCEFENKPNKEIIALISKLRNEGIRCYLATAQEKYRTAYIENIMFPGVFDGIFSSAHIGSTKPSDVYFRVILETLAKDAVTPEQIAYFDDSQKNIDAANAFGIQAYLYAGVIDLKSKLAF